MSQAVHSGSRWSTRPPARSSPRYPPAPPPMSTAPSPRPAPRSPAGPHVPLPSAPRSCSGSRRAQGPRGADAAAWSPPRWARRSAVPVRAVHVPVAGGHAPAPGVAAASRMDARRSATHWSLREPVGVVGAITPWNYPLHQIVAKVAPALAGRQHGRAQAERGRAADGVHPRRGRRRGRPAGRACSTSSRAPARSSARRSPRIRTSTWCRSPAPPAPAGGSRELAAQTVKRVALELGGKSRERDPRRRRPRPGPSRSAWQVRSSTPARPAPRGRACSCRAAPARRDRRDGGRGGRGSTRSATRRRGDAGSARWSPRRSASGCAATSSRASPRAPRWSLGGTEPPDGLERGYYVRPTVFADVDPTWPIAQEEIFGPVLSVIPYDDEDEAVAIANDTVYGLAGGVWSASRSARCASRGGCAPARSTSTAAPSTRWRRSAATSSPATAASSAASAWRSSWRRSRSSADRGRAVTRQSWTSLEHSAYGREIYPAVCSRLLREFSAVCNRNDMSAIIPAT